MSLVQLAAMLSVETEHLNKRHVNCHVYSVQYTGKYFVFINYSMYLSDAALGPLNCHV